MVRTLRSLGLPRRGMARHILTCAALLSAVAGAAGLRPALAQREAPPAVLAEQPAAAASEPAPPAAAEGRLPVAARHNPGTAPGDLSPIGMFLNADLVVQGVMILLSLASVATWTVLSVRSVALLLAKGRIRRSIAQIGAAESLSEAGAAIRRGLAARLVATAAEEVTRSAGLPSDGIKERAQVALGRIEAAAAKRAASGTGILATIGSTGPFVGLFGTVWGIMHSFVGIAESHTTNLAVVAPGIAEALLATGIGLVAAIPAVVIYNALTRAVASYRALVSDAVALILCHLSRDLDQRAFLGRDHRRADLHVAAE